MCATHHRNAWTWAVSKPTQPAAFQDDTTNGRRFDKVGSMSDTGASLRI